MSPPVRAVSSDAALPKSVDVVVIGGGVAGVCAAWELARKGTRVALVEKGRIAAEQSSRNWGWCRQQNRDERELPLAIEALRIWDTLRQETGEELGFRRSGLVYGTNSQADMARWEQWGRMAREYGVDTRMLTGGEVARLLPGNTRSWTGGVHSPTDGRAEPELAVPAIASAAQKLGATMHQNCAVRELDISAGRISGVITEKGRISCGAVLLAGGAWTGMLLRHHGLKFLQASVQSTSFSTVPSADVTDGGVAMADVTFRKRLDGGYTVGLSNWGRLHVSPMGIAQCRPFWKTFQGKRAGLSYSIGKSFFTGPDSLRRWRADQVSPFERSRVLDPLPEARLVRKGLDGLKAAYPAMQGVRVAHQWAGIVDMTPDALPVIGPVRSVPGLHVSAGHSGHGFGVGPAAGRLSADLIRGDRPIVDQRPFRYERMIDGTDLGAMGMM